jgi:Skp family chaperone for outer membrane proteins
MITKFKSAALVAALAAATAFTTPALAQRGGAAPAAPVVVVADIDAAVQQSAAFTTAVTQIQTTYAPQIQNLNVRRQALQTELQTLFQAAQTAQAATPRNEQNVQNAIRAFQAAQQAAEREVAELNAPIELAVSYVQEQITLRMNEAVTAARTARRADIVLTRGAAIQVADSANITPAIVTELNRLVPNVQIVPPQGYEPGSLMRAQQQQAAAAAAGTPAPAAAPETR